MLSKVPPVQLLLLPLIYKYLFPIIPTKIHNFPRSYNKAWDIGGGDKWKWTLDKLIKKAKRLITVNLLSSSLITVYMFSWIWSL